MAKELLWDKQSWKVGLCVNRAHILMANLHCLKHFALVLSRARAGGAWEEISCLQTNQSIRQIRQRSHLLQEAFPEFPGPGVCPLL